MAGRESGGVRAISRSLAVVRQTEVALGHIARLAVVRRTLALLMSLTSAGRRKRDERSEPRRAGARGPRSG